MNAYVDRDRIIDTLHLASSVVVLSHYNPDPDAYGSLCGLALSLQAAGKKVSLLNESGVTASLSFIPGVAGIVQKCPPLTDGTCIVACDRGSYQRIGDVLGPLLKESLQSAIGVTLCNIDHHVSNDGFAALNWVDTSSSSTSQMILELLEAAQFPISADVASSLYVGILGDTGSFRYSSTSASTFQAAARLVNYGAPAADLTRKLFGNQSLRSVRLQAKVLSDMKLFENDTIALVQVSHELFEASTAQQEDVEGLVDKARDIAGVQVAIAITEREKGLWKVSLRSKSPEYDLNLVASSFGGGGHKAAAAFRSKKSPEDFLDILLGSIQSSRQHHQGNS